MSAGGWQPAKPIDAARMEAASGFLELKDWNVFIVIVLPWLGGLILNWINQGMVQ